MTLDVRATMLVLWLAHTWAAIAGERIHLGHGLLWHRIKALGREEWPIVEAGFVPLIPLALGWIGVLEHRERRRGSRSRSASRSSSPGASSSAGGVYHTWLGALLAGARQRRRRPRDRPARDLVNH